MKKKITLIISVVLVLYFGIKGIKKINFNTTYEVGQVIDSLNHVKVYYNGGVSNTEGRNLAIEDGYNLGIKYQCVEFIKRYYYEHLGHKMPDTYGNAKDFFDASLKNGDINTQRNLIQYHNGAPVLPKINDILIFDSSLWNPYGHVAIVASVKEDSLTIIQQNPGPFGDSRETMPLQRKDQKYYINNNRVLGWLTLKK